MYNKNPLQEYSEIINDHTLPSIIDFVKWSCGISMALIIFSTSLMQFNPSVFLKWFYSILYIALFLSIIFGTDFVAFSLNVEKQKMLYSQAENKIKEFDKNEETKLRNEETKDEGLIKFYKTQLEESGRLISDMQDKLYVRYVLFMLSLGIGFLMTVILCLKKLFS